MKDERVIFKRKVGRKGESLAITIPIELINYLEIEDGDTIHMYGELGKHGRYVSFWNTKQEE